MKHRIKHILASGVLVVIVATVVGCSSSPQDVTNSAVGDSAVPGGNEIDPNADEPVCELNQSVAADLRAAATDRARLDVLAAHEPDFDQVLASAPAEIRASLEVMISESRTAIASDDLAVIDPQRFEAAGRAIDSFCGLTGY